MANRQLTTFAHHTSYFQSSYRDQREYVCRSNCLEVSLVWTDKQLYYTRSCCRLAHVYRVSNRTCNLVVMLPHNDNVGLFP